MLSASVILYADQPVDLVEQCLHFTLEEDFPQFMLLGFIYLHLV
jgi:hypothetical protein